MPRLNGLQYSKANQITATVFSVLMLGLLVFFVINRAPWWAVAVATVLTIFGVIVVYFARKPER